MAEKKRSRGRPPSVEAKTAKSVRFNDQDLANIAVIKEANALTSDIAALRFALKKEADRARSGTSK